MMYYSRTAQGFFSSDFHTNIPSDAVKISDEQYKALIRGQEQGQTISSNYEGVPYLTSATLPAVTSADRRKQILDALTTIDTKKIRAISDFLLTNDKTRLEELEAEAAQLRAEYAALE